MEEKKRKGYKTQEQQNEANKRYRATEKGKELLNHSNYKSKAKKFIKNFANLEELKELEDLIKNKKEELNMSNIIFNGVEYNLYEVKGGDMFQCENLNMFAWKNRVEFKVDESEFVPATLEELESKIEEVNSFFEKNKKQRGWFFIPKSEDESSSF